MNILVRCSKRTYEADGAQLYDASYSQYFLPNLMDMGSLLRTILGTILNYKRILMSTVKGPLMRLILTVAHVNIHAGLGLRLL